MNPVNFGPLEMPEPNTTGNDDTCAYQPRTPAFAAVMNAARIRYDLWDRPELDEPDSMDVPMRHRLGVPFSGATLANTAYRLGNRAAVRGDWRTAGQWYEEAVIHDHPGAAFRLAWLLLEQEHQRLASNAATHEGAPQNGTIERAEDLLELAAGGGHADAAHLLTTVEWAAWQARQEPRLNPERLFAHRLLGSRASDELSAITGLSAGDDDYPAQDFDVLIRLAACAYPLLSRETPAQPASDELVGLLNAALRTGHTLMIVQVQCNDPEVGEPAPPNEEVLRAMVLFFDEESGQGALSVDEHPRPVDFSLHSNLRGRTSLRAGEAIELGLRGQPGTDDCGAVLIENCS
ncbi:hypothetical protein [Embleya sp. NPDC020630]|uniref:hypothetical protein n=1 Tax=Embleya sp. NPDC020630 TaxID=3363979 RepID=UPI0037A4B835